MHDPSDPVSLLSDLELRRDAYVRLMERSVLHRVRAGYLEEIAKISEKIERAAAAAADDMFAGPLVEVELGGDDEDLLLDHAVAIDLLDHDPDEEGVEIELVAFGDEDLTNVFRMTHPYPVVEDRFRVPPL